MFVDRLLCISSSRSPSLLNDKRLATRAHMHTLANHIHTLLLPLSPQGSTLITSVCSARSGPCHLDPAISTQPLRKLNLSSTVVALLSSVDTKRLTPGLCAKGAEREEAFVSDYVVDFMLGEALGWRIDMTGGAD